MFTVDDRPQLLTWSSRSKSLECGVASGLRLTPTTRSAPHSLGAAATQPAFVRIEAASPEPCCISKAAASSKRTRIFELRVTQRKGGEEKH